MDCATKKTGLAAWRARLSLPWREKRSMKLLRVLLVDDEIMIREGFERHFDWQAHGCVRP